MEDIVVGLLVILISAALLTQDGIHEKSLKRIQVWIPIPILWTILTVSTQKYSEFWQSDRAALPAIIIILIAIGYGVFAIRIVRRYR